MKTRIIIPAMTVAAMLLSGCTTTSRLYSSANYGDDLYETHNVNQIAGREQARSQREMARLQAEEARQQIAADAAMAEYTSDQNPYSAILSDNYEDSYERRLKGFQSSTYKTPSSMIDAKSSSSIQYASAYDPAFYNVMVMGDQVWVEPKYVSSMFGNWGGATNINLNLSLWGYSSYNGWGSPYNNWWGYPYNGWWGSPYYDYGWGWGYPYYGSSWGPGWGHGWGPSWSHNHGWGGPYSKYNDKNTVYNRPRNGSTVTTPSYPGGSNGSTVNYRRGASVPSSSINNSTNNNSSTGSYRRPSSTTSGNATINQNSNSSTRRPSTINNNSNSNSSTTNSFRNNSSSSFGGSSSGSFGGSSGSSSGGSRSSGASGGASSGGGYRR